MILKRSNFWAIFSKNEQLFGNFWQYLEQHFDILLASCGQAYLPLSKDSRKYSQG